MDTEDIYKSQVLDVDGVNKSFLIAKVLNAYQLHMKTGCVNYA